MAKLTRSVEDKKFLGVCGGLADYFGWDSTIVRLIWAIVTIMGIGSPILLYFILALIMPDL